MSALAKILFFSFHSLSEIIDKKVLVLFFFVIKSPKEHFVIQKLNSKKKKKKKKNGHRFCQQSIGFPCTKL